MDGSVAAAGEDRVATGGDRLARLLRRRAPGIGSRSSVGLNPSVPQNIERGLQFALALLAAAGVRVVEQCRLAHSVVEAGLYLRVDLYLRAVYNVRSARTPLPHAEHCLLRQRMAELAGQHGDLPAVMGVVRDEISDKAGDIRAKTLDSAIALRAHDDEATCIALLLLARAVACAGVTVRTIELLRDASAFAAFSHITRTLCMCATMAAMSALAVGWLRIQAAGGRLSIR